MKHVFYQYLNACIYDFRMSTYTLIGELKAQGEGSGEGLQPVSNKQDEFYGQTKFGQNDVDVDYRV